MEYIYNEVWKVLLKGEKLIFSDKDKEYFKTIKQSYNKQQAFFTNKINNHG